MSTHRRQGIALAFLVVLGLLVPAAAEVRLGTVSVGAGFSYFSGPAWGPFWPYYYPAAYDPWVVGPWFAYSFYAPVVLSAQPNLGQVSLKSSHREAAVYLDGAYAGTVSRLKNFWLAPGVYELEVRPAGKTALTKRIYVLTGRTLKVSME